MWATGDISITLFGSAGVCCSCQRSQEAKGRLPVPASPESHHLAGRAECHLRLGRTLPTQRQMQKHPIRQTTTFPIFPPTCSPSALLRSRPVHLPSAPSALLASCNLLPADSSRLCPRASFRSVSSGLFRTHPGDRS